MYTCVTTHIDSSLTNLYNGSWSPSHVDLCHFKVSVLVPLEWGYQTLSCFGFSIYSHIFRICFPLVMWSKSNHIAAFVRQPFKFSLKQAQIICDQELIIPPINHLVIKLTSFPIFYLSTTSVHLYKVYIDRLGNLIWKAP
jgi:hypothetical protein